MNRRQFLFASALAPILREVRAARHSPLPRLELITTSDYQWTGVAVSKADRVFVSFPTISEFPSYHVAELKGGVPVRFLDREANSSFRSVTGIVVDSEDRLWALDSGKLEGMSARRAGARLVCIDLRRNQVKSVHPIPPSLLVDESDLSDFRIDTAWHCAYISDAGAGGLIVIDLKTDRGWLALDRRTPETRANARFVAMPAGNVVPASPHIDGVTLSEDGRSLYFTPLIETRIFGIPTECLADGRLTPEQRRRKIRTIADNIHPSAGMVVRGGVIYMGDLQNSKLLAYSLASRRARTLEYPTRFHWADDFALDARGRIWFTESQKDIPVARRRPYRLFRLTPAP